MPNDKKICPKCGGNGPFATNRAKNDGLEVVCKECRRVYTKAHYQANKSDYVRNNAKKDKDATSLARAHSRRSNVALAIYQDSRRSDRKRGLVNDLDLETIQRLIEQSCTYCGETEIRMTLDRIDNSIGHTKDNVKQACERCNYARRNMPYAAWLIVAVAMRKARLCGLFGEWTGAVHHRGKLKPLPKRRLPPAHGTMARYKICGPPTCGACKRACRDYHRDYRKRVD